MSYGRLGHLSHTVRRYARQGDSPITHVLRASSVTFVNIAFENCTFKAADGPQAIVEVDGCQNGNISGVVALHHVTFRNNTLVGSTALRMSTPSCHALEMFDVEISHNECSSDACGVLLAQTNRITHCSLVRNDVIGAMEQHPFLLSAPASSNTVVKDLEARHNKLTVFRVQHRGHLSLSKSSFTGNAVGEETSEFPDSSCVHLSQASAEIDDCVFTENRGERGATVAATKSTITVFRSAFLRNKASTTGGCIHAAAESIVKLRETTATKNNAETGGFVYAVDSDVTLEDMNVSRNSAFHGGCLYATASTVHSDRMHAEDNKATIDGGCVSIRNSVVELNKTNARCNEAGVDGGFIRAWNSTVTMRETNAVENSVAVDGGFFAARNSKVTCIGTNATDNEAGFDGGFIRAWNSMVELKDTTATNNKAERGGFVYIWFINTSEVGTTHHSAAPVVYVHSRDSVLKLEKMSATNNSATENGGLVYAASSEVKMRQTNATGNRATRGGCIYARDSTVVDLVDVNVTNNFAKGDGGVVYAANSEVNVTQTDATGNNATLGGCIYAEDLKMWIVSSSFSTGRANSSGGFIAAQETSVFLRNSSMTGGWATRGGAVSLDKSQFDARHSNIAHCSANVSGGGIAGGSGSTLLCADCVFRGNTVENGNGGALYFDAESDPTLQLQLVRSRVKNNMAEFGGDTPL